MVVRTALFATQNQSVEAALEWLLENESEEDEEDSEAEAEPHKMVLVFNTSLGMGVGKVAAQVRDDLYVNNLV
ncbi:hypothetical protein QYM36_005185 [Artemia franciscana]|uniref:UBA domain-containing protein n=1 Tax=Artemia franciscana TaxID=6661 RepID=A0AA88LBS2_ARTSF|nr:hypothetical protein QYM36_005185 [Artemia franciscana]